MNIAPTIFNSILHREFRPWQPENKDEDKFRVVLKNGLRAEKDNPKQFFAKLNKLFSYRIDIEIPENESENSVFKMNNPAYFNKITEFYSYLISNEAVRLFTLLDNVKSEYPAEQDRKYHIYTAFKQIEDTIKQSNSTKAEYSVNSQEAKYVFDLLSLTLFKLYTEIKTQFLEYIGDEALSKQELLYILAPAYKQNKDISGSLASYINQYLDRNESIKQDKQKSKTKAALKPVDVSLHSFTYKKYSSNSSNLTDLCDSLKKNNFIAQETSVPAFKKVFSGNEITEQVVWRGNPSEFAYFIKLLHNKYKLVKDLKQRHWEVALKCFIPEDGIPFDRNKLRNLKKPKLTFELLENAVNLLK